MLDRTLAPPFVKSTSFHLPPVSKATLANGVKVIQLENIQQKLVKIEVIFDAGKWYEQKPEASHFTVQMLDKGTKSMSSRQIAEILDRYGAHLELTSNLDHASVSLYSLTKHVKSLLPVFFEIISSPSFAKKELEQLKDHFIQSLRIKNEKTSYLASKLIRKKIFGATHPYGQSAEEADITNITDSDLSFHFTSRMNPTHIFVLGQIDDLDFDSVKENINAISIKAFPVPAATKSPNDVAPVYLEKENSVQSSIRLGKCTIQRDHTDFAGLTILNYYLGGYFGSRLMKNLREDKGLTYGISSSISSFKHESLLLIGTDINKENRRLAVDEILKEINLLKSSINEDELELAKRHFIGSLQGEIASPFSILGKIKNIELNQLPVSYYQDLISKINNVSVEELIQIAEIHLKEDSLFEVVIG